MVAGEVKIDQWSACTYYSGQKTSRCQNQGTTHFFIKSFLTGWKHKPEKSAQDQRVGEEIVKFV